MASYDTLNPKQQEAVFCTEGPLLILAGAGSGKTRVITHRIAYLIQEKGVDPWNILAITFTNKAANEMRERVDKLVETGAGSVWVSTFHSACVRILRRYINALGYDNDFTIYDTDDSKTLMRQILKSKDLDPRQFREKSVLAVISAAKDELIGPEEFMRNAEGSWHERKVAELYEEYQKQLKKNNALDFDDLIFKTIDLFRSFPQILDYYQERFRYIHVDEYQDTNTAQFEFVALLAAKYRNLCVVGDDDQSIYKFRGANINNILEFEETFPGTKVIRLEQNYRSTKKILDVANSVIGNNKGRKGKTLWTANDEGVPVEYRQYDQAWEEAEGIMDEILKDKERTHRNFDDYAVLYRTNAQSRLLEERAIAEDIPYRLVGGVNFYQRKEIKDVLAYLKTIANGADDLASERIINVPKRGIGAATVGKLITWAAGRDVSFYEACRRADEVESLGKAREKVKAFSRQIEGFRTRLEEGLSIKELIEAVVQETGYAEELEEEGEIEAQTRMENIEELVNKAVSYEEETEDPKLGEFLEEVALVADVDSLDDSENRVTLMTLHSAKGLEFPVVFIAGMEDGLFPGTISIISDDPTDVEEERRLCYVGITRAKKRLILTGARMRMTHGETHCSARSRFVDEIPEDLLLTTKKVESYLDGGVNKSDPRDYDDDLPWNSSGKRAASRDFGGRTKKAAKGFGEPSQKAAFGRSFTVNKADSLDYSTGDRVIHSRFGEGTVQDIKDGPKDFEVTVEFDNAGVKKMFASFAKLKKI